MTVAYVSLEGMITDLAAKPSAMRRLAPGERVLPYSEPAHDPEVETAVPVQPVPAEAEQITFTLAPLEGSAELKKAKLLAKVDRDVDEVYALAIGNRGPEYTQAELEATAYQTSGYTLDPVPPYVASWATASNLSAQVAAESILAQAGTWRAAAAAIRAQRLAAKAAIRGGNLSLQTWDSFVVQLKSSLGL